MRKTIQRCCFELTLTVDIIVPAFLINIVFNLFFLFNLRSVKIRFLELQGHVQVIRCLYICTHKSPSIRKIKGSLIVVFTPTFEDNRLKSNTYSLYPISDWIYRVYILLPLYTNKKTTTVAYQFKWLMIYNIR